LQVGPAGGVFAPSCGNATLTAAAGANLIQFSGGSVAPGQTCVVTVPVRAPGLLAGLNLNYTHNPVILFTNQADPVTAGPVTLRIQT
jgi:hypothetical protein